MSLTARSTFTHAESALINNFNEQGSYLPGTPDIYRARLKAIEMLQEHGLPSRLVESWHYTDLRVLLKNIPQFTSVSGSEALAPLIAGDVVLCTNNGQTTDAIGLPTSFNDIGLSNVSSFARALQSGAADLSLSLDHDDPIGWINTAYVSDGWCLDVLPGRVVKPLIELQNIQTAGQGHIRSAFSIGENSQCVFIDRQISFSSESLRTCINHLVLQENSTVDWIIIHDEGLKAINLGRVCARLEKGAKLRIYVVNIGAQLVRQEIKVDMVGEDTNFILRGVNLLARDTHTDVTMVVRHLSEHTTSSEIMRNVVTDHAKGAFQGLIRVAKEAQKTDAKMTSNSLFLSGESEFDAKPELEIFADDVVCGHGATVAQLDHENLFYLMARGIPYPLARALLVKAFVAELVDELENESLKEALGGLIDQWLLKHA